MVSKFRNLQRSRRYWSAIFVTWVTAPLSAIAPFEIELDNTSNSIVEVVTGGYEAIAADREKQPVSGPRTTAVEAFLNSKNVSYRINTMMWARAFRRVQSEPYTLIYPLTRTPDREAHFDWIKEIDSHEYHLLGHVSLFNKGLKKSDIISGKYFAVCEETTANCEMLVSFGFPYSAIIEAKGKEVDGVASLVATGRASFMIENITAMRSQANDFVRKTVVRIGDYAAVSREYLAGCKTAPSLLQQLVSNTKKAADQNAFEKQAQAAQ